MINYKTMQKIPCPKCHRKGLHYANHPHAFGWKDYNYVKYRFCNYKFPAGKIIERNKNANNR